MENVHGTSEVTLTIPAFATARYLKLYQWETQKLGSIGKRPSFEKWLESYLSGKASVTAEKYAEQQAVNLMFRLVSKYAAENNVTPLEACDSLGIGPADAGISE